MDDACDSNYGEVLVLPLLAGIKWSDGVKGWSRKVSFIASNKSLWSWNYKESHKRSCNFDGCKKTTHRRGERSTQFLENQLSWHSPESEEKLTRSTISVHVCDSNAFFICHNMIIRNFHPPHRHPHPPALCKCLRCKEELGHDWAIKIKVPRFDG